MASIVPRARILDLQKLRCKIFNTNFNPTNQRLGNKILRQRLKGPTLARYYPPRVRTVQELRKAYPHGNLIDDVEQKRLEGIELRKYRGKGTPKKKKTAEESKRFHKRRPGMASS